MITLCTPTRGRPKSMARLIESIRKTANQPNNIEIIFYIDQDDLASQQEIELIPNDNIKAVIGPQIVLSQTWNKCQQAGQGPIFMLCADDIVFESNDWDQKIIDEFSKYPDKIVLVYGQDGGKNERLATHPFIHKNWIDTVGYFLPPYFEFCMNDTWLFAVANMIKRCVYLPDVVTAHWNCGNRKYTSGQPDKTWLDMQARGIKQDFRGIYHKKAREREENAKKLLAFIEDFRKND